MGHPKGKDSLPSIPWLSNGGVLIWALLAEVQKTENRKVLFGPAPEENTGKDTKIAVYGRIGSIILPEEYKTHPGDVAKRVKGKAEELFKTYKIQAERLRVTGGGIGAPGDVPGDGVHVYQLYHIPEDGPHHDTPQVASNLCEQISEDFPYFAELHKFLCTRPNIIPPVVTTGVGPLGRQVVHHQQPDPRGFDKNIDPTLFGLAVTPPRPVSPALAHPGSPGSADPPLMPREIRTNQRV
ncbi:hypothetical protein C8J57DRAFT_479770, partial [Mycena rebaudengoi]